MSASRQSSPAPVSLSSASFATMPPHLRRTSYTTLSRSTSPDARSSSARSSRRSSLDGLVSLSLGGERGGGGGLSLAALLQYAALLLSIRSFLLAWPALSLTHASLALLSASTLELRAKAEGFGLRRSALVACAALALVAGALAYAPRLHGSEHSLPTLSATLCLEGEDGLQVRLYDAQLLPLGGAKHDRCKAPSEAHHELLRSASSTSDEQSDSWMARADRLCVAASELSRTAAWSGIIIVRRGRSEPRPAARTISVECN